MSAWHDRCSFYGIPKFAREVLHLCCASHGMERYRPWHCIKGGERIVNMSFAQLWRIAGPRSSEAAPTLNGRDTPHTTVVVDSGMEGQLQAGAPEDQLFISNPYFGTFEEAAASSLKIGTSPRLPQIIEHSTTETSKSAALSPTTSNLGTVTLYTPSGTGNLIQNLHLPMHLPYESHNVSNCAWRHYWSFWRVVPQICCAVFASCIHSNYKQHPDMLELNASHKCISSLKICPVHIALSSIAARSCWLHRWSIDNGQVIFPCLQLSKPQEQRGTWRVSSAYISTGHIH